jgi:hypothetical protein
MSVFTKSLLSVACLAMLGFAGCDKSTGDAVDSPAPATSDTSPAVPAADAGAMTETPAVDATAAAGSDAAAGADTAAAATAPPPPNPIAEMAKNLKPEDIDKGLKTAVTKIEEMVAGITDEATAQAALPVLRDVRTQLTFLKVGAEHVPGDIRPMLIEKFGEIVPSLEAARDKLYENEAVKPIVESYVDGILNRIASIISTLEQPAPGEAPVAGEESVVEEVAAEPANSDAAAAE